MSRFIYSTDQTDGQYIIVNREYLTPGDILVQELPNGNEIKITIDGFPVTEQHRSFYKTKETVKLKPGDILEQQNDKFNH